MTDLPEILAFDTYRLNTETGWFWAWNAAVPTFRCKSRLKVDCEETQLLAEQHPEWVVDWPEDAVLF